jgi:hypothetical protein
LADRLGPDRGVLQKLFQEMMVLGFSMVWAWTISWAQLDTSIE